MASLMDRMLKIGKIKDAAPLDKSVLFNEKDNILTDLPILNIALSGRLDSGVQSGLTLICGKSKHYKSNLGLIMVSAFLNKYPDAICIFMDSEFGITTDYLASHGVDASRVLHVPVMDIEELKLDLVQKLEALTREEKVIVFVDSIGNLSSKKEREDAIDGKSVGDMSRAKSLKSCFRIITPYLTAKDIPMVAINHVYDEISLFPKAIVGGGQGIYLSSDTIFIIGRQQEKDSAGDIEGWNFILNVEKSRRVKEKAKLPILVTYAGGISKTSGLQELATDIGAMASPSKGWYSFVDLESGEMEDKKYRAKDLLDFKVWEPVLSNPVFKQAVAKRYQVSYNSMIQSEESEDE